MKKYTKDEIRAARELRRQGRKMITEGSKLVRQASKILLKPHRVEMEFRTWAHDVRVLMPAIARIEGLRYMTPAEMATRAAEAADQMKHEVQARRPPNMEDRGARVRSHLENRSWYEWQESFDGIVHALAENSQLDATAVVKRATAIADEMTKVIEKRRPKA